MDIQSLPILKEPSVNVIAKQVQLLDTTHHIL